MAITAVMTLRRSTAQVNTKVQGSLAISNSGGADVNLLSIAPQAKLTGSDDPPAQNSNVSFGLPAEGYTAIVVPAGGSVAVKMSLVPFAPSTGGTFDISADISTSDGSEVRATAATLTVSQVPQFIG